VSVPAIVALANLELESSRESLASKLDHTIRPSLKNRIGRTDSRVFALRQARRVLESAFGAKKIWMRLKRVVASVFSVSAALPANIVAFTPIIAAKIAAAMKRLFYRHFHDARDLVSDFVQSAKTFAATIRLRWQRAPMEETRGGSYTQN